MFRFSLYNKIFLIFVVAIIISVSIVGAYALKSTSQAYIDKVYATAMNKCATIDASITGNLTHVPKDLAFASEFYALRNFLTWHAMGEEKKEQEWKQIFSATLLDFLMSKEEYYQARVIDLNGNEIINARYSKRTHSAYIVKDSLLQNKAGREYVEKAKELKKGEFYISSMNLNIENKIIEKPYVPVVRFSTPIIGTNGEIVALFVINTYANNIINIVEEYALKDKDNGASYYLINQYGDYLYNVDEKKMWNEQLEHGNTFNNDYFNIGNYIKKREHGSFRKNKIIYTYYLVHPFEEHSENTWYIISSVKESVALSQLDEFKMMFILLIFFVILFGFIIVRYFVLKITNPILIVTEQLQALSRGEIRKEKILYESNDEIGQIVKSTNKVIDVLDKIIIQADAVSNGQLHREMKLLSPSDKLGTAINNMTKRLQEIESLAKKLSYGNYDVTIALKGEDDKLGVALSGMIKYLNNIAYIAESISNGELNIDYKIVGNDDRLGITMLKMLHYLKKILNQANAIAREDFSKSIVVKSNKDDLGIALVTMTDILSKNAQKNKDDTYFNDGISSFSDAITGLENIDMLSEKALSKLTRYVGASKSALYVFNEDTNMLHLKSSFSYSKTEEITHVIALGENIIGQVALEKNHLLIKNIQVRQYKIQTAVTAGYAQESFVFPLLHENNLFGVIEVMCYSSFTELHKEYLLKIADILATLLHLNIQSTQIKTLLEKSQAAFEELQSQSEELQESNVQMEEQQQQLTMQSNELLDKNKTLAIAKQEIDERAKELEATSKYKSEFLANMSHELRTPLNSIILLSKLLSQNNNLSDKELEKSQIINKSGKDLLYLINDILDLTKIESGNMELHLTKVHSPDLISEMKGLFFDLAQEKNLSLEFEDTYNDIFVTDKEKFAQVLKNILSNAIKFTHVGTISVEVKAENGLLNIIVSDTGIGIAQDKLDSIFDAFKQVDGSISREFGGTGLGLSITKTILDLMNAQIEVTSEPKKGTTFSIFLPLLKEHPDVVDSIEMKVNNFLPFNDISDEDEELQENSLESKNILIVDDDSRNIFTLTSLLESSGAEVFSAFNGTEAIAIVKKEKIDLILMDMMMPVMDGLEATKIIKSMNAHLPIIAITANTGEEDKQKCLDAGADEYLSKPIDTNSLFSMLHAWIK